MQFVCLALRQTGRQDEMMSTSDIYEIRVEGHLDPSWSDWFEGMSIHHEESGETVISGPVVDQAGLHGVLMRIRDLGLPLVAVARRKPIETRYAKGEKE